MVIAVPLATMYFGALAQRPMPMGVTPAPHAVSPNLPPPSLTMIPPPSPGAPPVPIPPPMPDPPIPVVLAGPLVVLVTLPVSPPAPPAPLVVVAGPPVGPLPVPVVLMVPVPAVTPVGLLPVPVPPLGVRSLPGVASEQETANATTAGMDHPSL